MHATTYCLLVCPAAAHHIGHVDYVHCVVRYLLVNPHEKSLERKAVSFVDRAATMLYAIVHHDEAAHSGEFRPDSCWQDRVVGTTQQLLTTLAEMLQGPCKRNQVPRPLYVWRRRVLASTVTICHTTNDCDC